MTTSANSETELLTEHFGYPPVSLIDDIINSVNVLAERALNSVEQGLLNAPPAALGFKPPKPKSSRQGKNGNAAAGEGGDNNNNVRTPAEQAKDEVEAGTHQLETLLCASIDRNFDKFELYVLRNIFTVRPPELCNWIRLSHYDGLDFSSSLARRRRADQNQNNNNNAPLPPTDTPTIESITALRRRLRESMRLNALLTAEHTRNAVLLTDLRRLVGAPASSSATTPHVKLESGTDVNMAETSEETTTTTATAAANGNNNNNTAKSPFAFLHQKGDLASSGGGAAAPLATTAAFTLSQMQALRALSTALSNVAPDLKISATTTATEMDDDDDDDGDDTTTRGGGWRRERTEYVEAATRRHLETVHGLELGRHGEVRDGEWQGPGRNLASGEVEGLEHVVALLEEAGAGAGAQGQGQGQRDRATGGGGGGEEEEEDLMDVS